MTDPMPTDEPAPGCVRLTGFAGEANGDRWRMLNDNVMGGRSRGEVNFVNGTMMFSGFINTDGGGFSSVRYRLDAGALEGVGRMVLRARTDGRAYRLIAGDAASSRVVHRAELAFEPSGGWQTVAMPLPALTPSLRGDPVQAPPFDPARASWLGLMLNDGKSGPFELIVDWIDVCG